jgi:hypothetical protein
MYKKSSYMKPAEPADQQELRRKLAGGGVQLSGHMILHKDFSIFLKKGECVTASEGL